MASFLLLLLALVLCTGQSAAGSPDPGLRAVKAGTKHAKGTKRRTLEEWRQERMEARAAAARARLEADRTAREAAPDPEEAQVGEADPEGAPDAAVPPSQSASMPDKVSQPSKEPIFRRYLRELQALIALLTLWLIARIYTQSHTKHTRKPHVRPSPISGEELGRILYGVGRANDVDTYRALFLNGAEAMQILGANKAERYLSHRSLAALADACEQLAQQLPSGTSYVNTEVTPSHQCILNVANPDGSGRRISVGTIAEVGAVLRLVTPATGTALRPEALAILDSDDIPPL